MGLSRKLSTRKLDGGDGGNSDITLLSPRKLFSKMRQKTYSQVDLNANEPSNFETEAIEASSPRRSFWRQLSMRQGLAARTSLSVNNTPRSSAKPSVVPAPCLTDDESEQDSLQSQQQKQEQQKQCKSKSLEHAMKQQTVKAAPEQDEESSCGFSVTATRVTSEQEGSHHESKEDDSAYCSPPLSPRKRDVSHSALISPTKSPIPPASNNEIPCSTPITLTKSGLLLASANQEGEECGEVVYGSPPTRRKWESLATAGQHTYKSPRRRSTATSCVAEEFSYRSTRCQSPGAVVAAAAASVLTPNAASRSHCTPQQHCSPVQKRYFRTSRHTSTDKKELVWSLQSYMTSHTVDSMTEMPAAPCTPSRTPSRSDMRRSSLSMGGGGSVLSTPTCNSMRLTKMGDDGAMVPLSTPNTSMRRNSLSTMSATVSVETPISTPTRLRRSSLSMATSTSLLGSRESDAHSMNLSTHSMQRRSSLSMATSTPFLGGRKSDAHFPDSSTHSMQRRSSLSMATKSSLLGDAKSSAYSPDLSNHSMQRRGSLSCLPPQRADCYAHQKPHPRRLSLHLRQASSHSIVNRREHMDEMNDDMEDDESDAITFADCEDDDETVKKGDRDDSSEAENDELLQFSQTNFEAVVFGTEDEPKHSPPRLVRQSSTMVCPKDFDDFPINDENPGASWGKNEESGVIVIADSDDEENDASKKEEQETEDDGDEIFSVHESSESSSSSSVDGDIPTVKPGADPNELGVEPFPWKVNDYYMGERSGDCFDEWKKYASKEKLQEKERRRARRRAELSD